MRTSLIISFFLGAASLAVLSGGAEAQTPRRTPVPRTAATPQPRTGDAVVVSRADDIPADPSEPQMIDENGRPVNRSADTGNSAATIEELRARLRRLEESRNNDPDEKQRRLALNLEILTKAEQRSDNLRKQLFEMIEKENAVTSRLDQIETDIQPESIDRSLSTIGSLRPEELRAQRKRSLELEKQNLQSLLAEIRKNRSNLELNVQRSDALVEKLRAKLDRDIDDALTEPTDRPDL